MGIECDLLVMLTWSLCIRKMSAAAEAVPVQKKLLLCFTRSRLSQPYKVVFETIGSGSNTSPDKMICTSDEGSALRMHQWLCIDLLGLREAHGDWSVACVGGVAVGWVEALLHEVEVLTLCVEAELHGVRHHLGILEGKVFVPTGKCWEVLAGCCR